VTYAIPENLILFVPGYGNTNQTVWSVDYLYQDSVALVSTNEPPEVGIPFQKLVTDKTNTAWNLPLLVV